jgi:NAD(P)-dependent dehydrogenase (short-subunit alcohol dehydrogenase family)
LDTTYSWVTFDAATGEDSTELLAALEAAHRPLRAAFCCIGAPSSKRTISETALPEFTQVFAANALSFITTWQAIAGLARAAGTSVVALSSDAADTARPGNGPYAAAKAALQALVVTLAKEEQIHGVRVNAVAPSLVDSPLAEEVLTRKGVTDRAAYYAALPWGRPLSRQEVAAVALDIATAPHWRYATGQIFPLSART